VLDSQGARGRCGSSSRHTDRATTDPELWRRTLTIVLDGLCSVHVEPLPGTPPDSAQLAQIIGSEHT
jgi:hypothetical protein